MSSYSYLLKRAGMMPYPAKRARVEHPRYYVRFHMPAIDGLNEPAETRLVEFTNYRDRDWIEDMTANYAALGTLTTFFPDHP